MGRQATRAERYLQSVANDAEERGEAMTSQVAALVVTRSRSSEARVRVKAALAVGRHADALGAVRRARRSPSFVDDPLLALEEAEALFRLLRPSDALAVATAALRRGAIPRDLEARLRLCRAQALWRTGRPKQARVETTKAAALCTTPLTRARLHELLALASGHDHEPEPARRHGAAAVALYERGGSPEGVARALGGEASLLSDAGRLSEALDVHTRRLDTVSRTTRLDALAMVRNDRGCLLTVLGRWEEARAEIDRAADLFRQVCDSREVTTAGVSRAALDVAVGRLEAAGQALAQARQAGAAEHRDAAARAEALLVTSDHELAANDTDAAEGAASEALHLFRMLKDRRGECRGRVRRCHALVGQGRFADAVREARKALGVAPRLGAGLEALAHLGLGRALLRTDRSQAAVAFERVLALPAGRADLGYAARLGLALARAEAGREGAGALEGLESWGDRRLLAHCLTDMRELGVTVPSSGDAEAAIAGIGARATVSPLSAGTAPREVTAFLDAATLLEGPEDWSERFAAAATALRPALPWRRVALVADPGWEIRREAAAPRPLSPTDIARELAATVHVATALDLRGDPRFAAHPARVLLRIDTALLAPMGGGRWVYLDFAEERPGPSGLGLAVQFARLLSRQAAVPEPSPAIPFRFPEIVGRCPAMIELFQGMERVAASDVSVHVFGETGTGKERIARALHDRSVRSRGPFVPVNASSLSDELFESEMFGHVRGAFTGAVADRKGYVAEAEGGTLFIDEVTDLSAKGQAKLLRFLQEREYRRVGESSQRRANVRILTASNASFADRVARGLFRSDLVYRLNTVVLQLPPLRERGGDVRILAQHFLRQTALRMGRPVPALPARVAAALEKHRWPGNVRELANATERLLTFAGGGPLRVDLLPQVLDQAPAHVAGTLREAQWAFERDFVSRTLSGNGGNRVRTAAALGISRQALLQKIARLGL